MREASGFGRVGWAAALAWAGLATAIGIRLAGMAVDDFYISYRYAWNFAAGEGLVFNPGERVFGLTDPGVGLLLGALHFVTRIPIPGLGTAMTGAALVGIALVLLLEARKQGRTVEGLIGGTLLVGSSALWVNQGAGILPGLFLLLLAARVSEDRPALAGALSGAAFWMRPDAAVGSLVLGLVLMLRKRRISWAYAAGAGVVALVGILAAWAYFGTVIPNTLGAKATMAAANPESWSGERFWSRGIPILRRHWGPAWTWIAAAGIVGQIPLFRRGGEAGRLLVLFSAALAVAYPLLKVPFFFWYTVPTLAALLYGMVFLAGAVARWTGSRLLGAGGRLPLPRASAGEGRGGGSRWIAATIGAALLIPLLASLLPANLRWMRIYEWPRHLETYRQAGLWVRDNSEPGDEIAYVEIGVPAYYSERPVADLLGLVTPEVLPYVAAGDLPGAFLVHPTRFVFFHSRSGMLPLLQRRWFWRAYEEVYKVEERGMELTVFRRIPGSELPPARPPRGPRSPRGPKSG